MDFPGLRVKQSVGPGADVWNEESLYPSLLPVFGENDLLAVTEGPCQHL